MAFSRYRKIHRKINNHQIYMKYSYQRSPKENLINFSKVCDRTKCALYLNIKQAPFKKYQTEVHQIFQLIQWKKCHQKVRCWFRWNFFYSGDSTSEGWIDIRFQWNYKIPKKYVWNYGFHNNVTNNKMLLLIT